MPNSYVYERTEPNLYTVGFYVPNGRFEPESDWESAALAAARVHYLNGGPAPGTSAPESDEPELGVPNVPAIVHQAEQFKSEISAHMVDAADKAVAALARYKFQMFGYWAAIWVHLNRLSGQRQPNPFADLVNTARYLRAQDEIDREEDASAQSASEAT